MADAVNPGSTVNTTPSRAAEPVEQVDRAPGMLRFAAIMMFLLGGFQMTWAFVEFANATWIAANVYGSFGGYLWLWGIFDVLLALVSFYAGYDLLQGGAFGKTYGVLIAGFSAIRWFFYIPASPWVAVVIIAVDVLIIYGIVAHADYRRASY
jgi:hypothetical protein